MSDQKKAYEITPDGSLGILALGDVGIEKWRAVKAKKEAEEKKSTKDTTKKDGEETDK